MHQRVMKDERYFTNFNGKRPPVPGKEDDFDSQHLNQKIKNNINHQPHNKLSQLNAWSPLSYNEINSVDRGLSISGFQDSSSNLFDLIKESSRKLEDEVDPPIREDCVGETCDETAKTGGRETFISNPIFTQKKPNFLSLNYLQDHPKCCGEDEINSIDHSKLESPTTCLMWTDGLNSVLKDAEGLKLFRQFLEGELPESSKVLDFVFSCRGLQLMNDSDRNKLVEVAKLIHKRFVLKEAGLSLDHEVKKRLAERIKKIIDSSGDSKIQLGFSVKEIFVEALSEAERFLEREMYPLFLKSDAFLEYFQKESEVLFNNNNNSHNINNNTNNNRLSVTAEFHDSKNLERAATLEVEDDQVDHRGEDEGGVGGRRKPPPSPKMRESILGTFGSALQSLPEEKELELNSIGQQRSDDSQSISVLQLSSLSLLATSRIRQKHMEFPPFNSTPHPHKNVSDQGRLSNPYHVSYAPGSAQDSELQSLSSDTLTEDALSFTDSSLDGRLDSGRPLSMTIYKKQVRYIRNFAAKNHESNFPGRFIPRTERVPSDSNLATTKPRVFATMLIEKLQVVKENQEKMERIMRIMQGLQKNHHGRNKSKPGHYLSVKCNHGDDYEDNAQSILDDHVSQLWNSFGSSPNHFHSGLSTPDDLKTKGEAPRGVNSFHHLPTFTNTYSGRGNSGQSCCDGSTNLYSKNSPPCFHHQCVARDYDQMFQNRIEGVSTEDVKANARRNSFCRTSVAIQSVITSASKVNNHRNKITQSESNALPRHTAAFQSKDDTGRIETGQQLRSVSLGKTTEPIRCLPKDDSERSSKFQSSRSAFSKHKKQFSMMNHSFDFDLTSSDLTSCLKAGHRDQTSDRSKPELVGISSSNVKMPSFDCKVASHTPDHFPSSTKAPRSKSLDRNKILSTMNNSKFSHASINSAFLECRPNASRSEVRSKPTVGHVTRHRTSSKKLLHNEIIQSTILPESTIVGYYMQNEAIPYRITMPGRNITLGQLKLAISKKENYRYFFKKPCSDFDTDVVHEEVSSDDEVLPLWEGKVVCRIERID